MKALSRRALGLGVLSLGLPMRAFADEPTTPLGAPPPPPPSVPPPIEDGAAPGPNATPPRNRSIAENYSVPVEGTEVVIAGATIGVNAPIADVQRILTAFHRYKDILPRIQQSRVVAEDNGTHDVYMRAPIMNGLAAVWGVARFPPLAPWRKRGFQLGGSLVSGNVQKWSGKWMAFPCGEKRTLLKLELFCEVGLPIPARIVNKWLLWACRKGVTAVRDMAECGKSTVAKD